MVKQAKELAKRKPLTASGQKKRLMARRFDKLKVKGTKRAGVIYIGHLPKGFNEPELKKFFSQFGEISKLRVARSKDSARSKGYAFIQYEEADIARVAAKAMDKYMMFGRQLQVHTVDEDDVHPDTFKHANREWKFVPKQLMHRNKVNRAAEAEKTPAERKARVEGLLQKEKERRDRLKELEIDYDFPGFAALVSKGKKAAVPEPAKPADKKSKKGKK